MQMLSSDLCGLIDGYLYKDKKDLLFELNDKVTFHKDGQYITWNEYMCLDRNLNSTNIRHLSIRNFIKPYNAAGYICPRYQFTVLPDDKIELSDSACTSLFHRLV